MKRIRPISIIIIIFSLALFGSYHIYYYCIDKINNNLVDNYLKEEVVLNNEEKTISKKISDSKEEYLGILEISKINLKLGFYNINSKQNNVNKNISLLKGSVMPNIKGSTIYLAAHSGNSYLGYFKNLKKLNINDELIINYRGVKYKYIINNIYNLDKNGYIEVNKNKSDNYLVLTTCNNDKQLVITSKLIK